MAEVFRKCCCLLIVLLVLAGGTFEMPKAEAFCKSGGLGLCGNGDHCQQSCSAKHGPGSQGSCDYSISPLICTCYYDCSKRHKRRPPPKMCDGGDGLCSLKCPDQCCNDRCAKKFSQGQGFCNNITGPWLCQCQYPC